MEPPSDRRRGRAPRLRREREISLTAPFACANGVSP